MPTYQYQCTECAEPLEAHQSFTDDALTVCPDCGGRLRKVFNAVGVVFKGSGFYRNDSREPAKASGFYRNDSRQTTNSGEPATSSGIESSAKDSGGKDSGGKDSDAKVSASKDSGDHGSSKPTKSTESSTNSTPAKKTGSDSAA